MVIIDQFASGAAVPEWLISQEPTETDAKALEITFAGDVAIVESQRGYIILPADIERADHIIYVANGAHVKIKAASKSVYVLTAHGCFKFKGPDSY